MTLLWILVGTVAAGVGSVWLAALLGFAMLARFTQHMLSLAAGDSVHAFGDGILIASAFLADARLGVITSLAVLAHEVPHHMGDLVVLRQTSGSARLAVVRVSLAGTVTALGGVLGYFLLSRFDGLPPYFLVAASSSFVYVALADLIPQLQTRLDMRETAAQVAWLLLGIALVTVVSGLVHRH